jgi:hypothetical protein
MVNFQFSLSSLIGLSDMALGVVFFILTIFLLLNHHRFRDRSLIVPILVLQLLFVPIPLVLAGIILLFQGWRLDPVLQLALLLLHSPVFFSLIKDLQWLRSNN